MFEEVGHAGAFYCSSIHFLTPYTSDSEQITSVSHLFLLFNIHISKDTQYNFDPITDMQNIYYKIVIPRKTTLNHFADNSFFL